MILAFCDYPELGDIGNLHYSELDLHLSKGVCYFSVTIPYILLMTIDDEVNKDRFIAYV